MGLPPPSMCFSPPHPHPHPTAPPLLTRLPEPALEHRQLSIKAGHHDPVALRHLAVHHARQGGQREAQAGDCCGLPGAGAAHGACRLRMAESRAAAGWGKWLRLDRLKAPAGKVAGRGEGMRCVLIGPRLSACMHMSAPQSVSS